MNNATVKRASFVIAITLVVVVTGYGVARVYLASQCRRAGNMLRDLESVKLGDPEVSVLALCQRHETYRQIPVFPKDANLEYEEPDYEFQFKVDPWHLSMPADHVSTVDSSVRAATATINPRLRRVVGLRKWWIVGTIGLKKGRVIAVTTSALVEGRDEWVGGVWRLLDTIPTQEIQRFSIQPSVLSAEANRYLVGWTHPNLSRADGSGEAVETWMTRSATPEERQSAIRFTLGCLTSLSGCRTVCDFVPGAWNYAKSGTSTERERACSPPRPFQYQE